MWPLTVATIALAIVVPAGMCCIALQGTSVQSETKMTIILTSTLAMNVLQALAAFRELSLTWPEPMKSTFQVCRR